MMLSYLSNLRTETELLEALNWDNELLESFHSELTTMLMAAPPNVEKAIFWLKNTPWDCFENKAIPEHIWPIVHKMIREAERHVHAELEKKQVQSQTLPYFRNNTNSDEEWN